MTSSPSDDAAGRGDNADADADGAADIPPAVAERLLRAFDQAPSTVLSLIDADLTTQWISRSSAWVIGTDPQSRVGRGSLENIHPDDGARLLEGLARLRAASPTDGPSLPVIEPLRYRKRNPDGSWVTMEALVQNMLDDPVVHGFVILSRPVGGDLDGVGHIVDLLVSDAPLPDVLAACTRLVPDYLGSAALVALVDGEPVVGAVEGTPAARLITDERWWRATLADGQARTTADFAGFPPELAARARADGFRSAWAMPLTDGTRGEVMGCVVIWVWIVMEPNIGTEHGLRQTTRLANLVIGEQRRHHSLRREAVTDPLTGLGNRSALRCRLDASSGTVALALVDLDDFKPVNDTYGHHTGDSALRIVAQRMAAAVRTDDLVVRFGGDEFAVVFAEGTPTEGVTRAVEHIRATVERPIRCDHGPVVSVGTSIGVATGVPTEVMHAADAALYEAKRAKGRRAARPTHD